MDIRYIESLLGRKLRHDDEVVFSATMGVVRVVIDRCQWKDIRNGDIECFLQKFENKDGMVRISNVKITCQSCGFDFDSCVGERYNYFFSTN